ncbi:MAG: hypothetical protein AAF488_09515 [Planctomycetota bacterium]
MALSVQDSPNFGPLAGSLIRSRWAIALLVALLVVIVGSVVGPRVLGSERVFLITSGALAACGYFAAAGYGLRKFIHRTPLAYEFAMKVPGEKLDRAELDLGVLRREVAEKRITGLSAVRKRARQILSQHGAAKVMVARVQSDAETPGGFRIDTLPRDPLGKVSRWFEAHLFLGLSSALLVAFHGRFEYDSSMAIALNTLALIVTATGLFGLWVWIRTPQILTQLETDLSTEEAFVLARGLDRRMRAAAGDDEKVLTALEPIASQKKSKGSAVERARSTLLGSGLEEDQASDLLALAGQLGSVRATVARLERVRRRLVHWKFIHVPPAMLLIVMIVIHIISVIGY